ncbi:MAG: hypothetical protein BGO43_01820 [Gammaproteobacteria bacterium 39-13]|nr:thioredoxin domain-containing protein [Gammaproteobacteria bacterium]OJV91819.1 MAG: hypothetical protein BGO43_01820 [Gammaproteobacteria bacterium 39-13]
MIERNRLSEETSPYLLQHAHNPVHWYAWNEEAIQAARTQNKPILLSIGYAACHWCHVMAHESFEDEQTAELMNRYFINIKVDREERPDLDKVYQQMHQILTQQGGGWPLTVFLSPESLIPFFSGTYFPKERRFQRPSFKEILQVVAGFYANDRDEIEAQNQNLALVIKQLEDQKQAVVHKIKKTPLFIAKEQWLLEFDEQNGGFKGAPKFPMPSAISAILYTCYSFVQEKNVDAKVLEQVMTTLEKMSQGGIYDHIGGGFFRYAVDEHWQIPHFEKMLYDNAQMISLYAQAYALSQDARFKNIVKGCIQWANEEMLSTEGGFYSSLDADSEGEEGKFYVWQKEELETFLDEKAFSVINQIYGLNEAPNFEEKWHLIEKHLPYTVTASEKYLFAAKEKMKLYRNMRVKPSLDDKLLCAWNALMLKGLSIAGMVLADDQVSMQATRLFTFIKNNLFDGEQLWVSYKQGKRKQTGFLDDYAFLLDACWYYLQMKWDQETLTFATILARKLIEVFWDHENGGFYFTSSNQEKLIYRPKVWVDDALPAGSAVAAVALQRFALLLNDADMASVADTTLKVTQALLDEKPQFFPNLLVLSSDYLSSPEIVIIHGKLELINEAKKLLLKAYLPHRFIFTVQHEAMPTQLGHYVSNDDLNIYICHGNVCHEPLKDLDRLKAYLHL